MSYRGFGADTEGPVPATEARETMPSVADRTPPYTQQALSLMGIAALPWAPVVLGAWLGDRALRDNGKLWGAAGGFALSFFTIRHFTKKLGGAIT